jgi:hypothetical protein
MEITIKWKQQVRKDVILKERITGDVTQKSCTKTKILGEVPLSDDSLKMETS